MRSFESLTEREILALAISLEEEDERIYADYAEGLRQTFPGTAQMLDGMREEESGHRRRLIDLYRSKFGEHIPLIRRNDVIACFRQRQHQFSPTVCELRETMKQENRGPSRSLESGLQNVHIDPVDVSNHPRTDT